MHYFQLLYIGHFSNVTQNVIRLNDAIFDPNSSLLSNALSYPNVDIREVTKRDARWEVDSRRPGH